MFGAAHTLLGENGHKTEINYYTVGRHYPATLLDPEEWPAIEVEEIRVKGKKGWLRVNQEKIMAKYGTEIAEAIEDRLRGQG